MPRIPKDIRENIKNLEHQELADIVLKLASKEKWAYDFVTVHYLNKEQGEQALFEEAMADLEVLFSKGYKGFSYELQMANMLTACIKRINQFTQVSKNKVLETDLLMHVLQVPFSLPTQMFQTCFTQYNTKVVSILKRLITLVTKKLHPDYRIEYAPTLNKYLTVLHQVSNHIDMVYTMPASI